MYGIKGADRNTVATKELYDLEDGEIGRTMNGRYWLKKGHSFWNEFNISWPSDINQQVEVVAEKPRLVAGQTFYYRGPKNPTPSIWHNLQFELHCGWRFRCYLKPNWKVVIPFWFQSTDPRVGLAQAEWSVTSGRIFPQLWEACQTPLGGLHIDYTLDGKASLHIDKMTNWMDVPSQ